MSKISDGDTGPDPGAAAYADVPLDYLDTGRDHFRQPVGAHHSRGSTANNGGDQ